MNQTSVVSYLKRHWLKWQLRRAHDGDASAMKRIYRLEDPWNLNVPEEHARFSETARLIRDRIGARFGSILEVGCGEGLQTEYLASLADRVVGIDPSPLAIQRACGRRIKNARFEFGELTSYVVRPVEPFDLVTACEMLYYLPDLEHAYQRLNALGKTCIATYYPGVYERLDAFFQSKDVEFATIHGRSSEWRVVWWSNQLGGRLNGSKIQKS
jgi:2-polyprenyl-3-methyl-5-hydroxy-6-metoxy-1,4-benzoquinol methylase